MRQRQAPRAGRTHDTELGGFAALELAILLPFVIVMLLLVVAFCGCGPFLVPRDADSATLEAKRQEVEAALNDMTARAYAIVDGKMKIAEAASGDAAA